MRKPIHLPHISEGWPHPLVEGDWYTGIDGSEWKLKGGIWQSALHAVRHL